MSKLTLALGIREHENRLAKRLVAIFAATQMSQALGANAADALFLVRLGVADLPLMISLSGLGVMVATMLHGFGLARRGPRRWLWAFALGAALVAGLEWVLARLGHSWAFAVIWVATQTLVWVTFTMMWNAAEAACDTRQAKRLFPLFAAGGVLGGVIGNLISGPSASLLGAELLLLLQAVLLGVSSYLLVSTRPLFGEPISPAVPVSFAADLRATLGAIRSSRLLALAAAAAFVMSMLFYLVVFPFNGAVASSFQTEAEVAGFLGVFSSVAAAATFLVSLLVTKRLFASLGIVLTLAAVPAVYLTGFAVWLFSFGLFTASVIRGLQWVSVNAIGSTAYAALFNAQVGRQRSQAMTFMAAVPAQLGTMAAGLVLVASAGQTRLAQFGVGLVVSIVFLTTVLAMRPAYIQAIMSAVKQGLVGVLAVPQRGLITPVDADARRILIDHLADPRPDTRALALAALARGDDATAAPAIEPLMRDEEPGVRAAAFDAICRVDPDRILERAEDASTDPAWEVRLNVLRALSAVGEEEHRDLAAGLLDDHHPRVAAAAATMVGGEKGDQTVTRLLRSQDPSAITAVFAEVVHSEGSLQANPSPFLAHPDRRVRAAAAASFRFWNGDPTLLLAGLDDRSVEVRRASAASLAHMPLGSDLIERVLESGTVNATDEMLRAITPAHSIHPSVLRWAEQEALRVYKLRSLWATVESETSATAAFLGKVLFSRADRLQQWVLKAITTTSNQEAMRIVERGLKSQNPEVRAQAIEALEMSGDRGAMGIVLPLLEPSLTRKADGSRPAVDELIDDFDPWLRALAIRYLAEQGSIVRGELAGEPEAARERVETLNLVDRVIALHRVAMLNELDPEDLELIAKATREVHFHAAEQIYVDGAEGGEMLVIVEGSAVVSKGRGASRELIETYGPGEHVGELALLGGGPRSADVFAGETGLHGVVITKEDLLSILEERPAVALGMLTTLAKRLAHQNAGRS